jgi:rhodanese-related sulfurtransferase
MKKYFTLLLSVFTLNAFSVTDPQTIRSLVQKDKAVIVDVREKDEIENGMLKDAIWFPLSKIEKYPNWEKDFVKLTQEKKVFLYCRSGNRSGKVMNMLEKKGIESENIGGYEALKKDLSK